MKKLKEEIKELKEQKRRSRIRLERIVKRLLELTQNEYELVGLEKIKKPISNAYGGVYMDILQKVGEERHLAIAEIHRDGSFNVCISLGNKDNYLFKGNREYYSRVGYQYEEVLEWLDNL